MSRLSPFGFLFGNSLTDLIRGIRRTQDAEQRAEYLRGVVADLREEARSQRLDTKTTAILKLAYLEMLGFDMSWAGFHVIEVMASPQFQQKRIGYIAAMQSFRGDTELLMLVTNLLKMDLVSQNTATVGIALSGLATIVTPLLAADVADDIVRMLTHSKPYIRQKAILTMYKVVLQYPEVLGTALNRLADLLDSAQQEGSDNDSSVVCAAISVIGELAIRSPSVHDFLELTPKLYAVFISTKHNWTLIKLLKVFKLFTEREPRLVPRLLPAIRNLLTTTEATSLIYESVNAILEGNMLRDDDFILAEEIVSNTLQLLNEPDQNLQYVTLGALLNVAKINPSFLPTKAITSLLHHPQPDPETRRRVLSLVKYIVNDDSLYDIVNELLSQFHATDYFDQKEDLASCICEACATENYSFVPDFQWLISALSDLSAEVASASLSSRLLDIVIRVKDASVRESVSALCFEWLSNHPDGPSSDFANICWWILGEFPTPRMREYPQEFISMTKNRRPTPNLATAVAKLVTKVDDLSENLIETVIAEITPWSLSLEYELQDRASQSLELFKLALSSPEQLESLIRTGLASLFSDYELGPIAAGSQLKIAVPDNLDLSTPIHFPAPNLDTDSDSESESDGFLGPEVESITYRDDPAELEVRSAERDLFNLSRPRTHLGSEEPFSDSVPSSSDDSKPPGRKKPVKKEVHIASDETVEGTSASTLPLTAVAPRSTEKPVFKVGFRGSNTALVEPMVDKTSALDAAASPAPLEPVKVKHKKKSKKSKLKKPSSSE